MSLPLRLLLRFAGNAALVWAMATYLDQYLFVTGGIGAYVIIGALLTLLNALVRPILSLITLPLRLLATLLAIILVNGVFLWITDYIVLLMDPNLVTMEILGGIGGWIVVSSALGIGNYLMKLALK
jgi:putative membrane protein